MDTQDRMMLDAFWMRTGAGLNDQVTNLHDGNPYWISSVGRRAGWQTAVFDRSRTLWIMRPILRINERENSVQALVNHLTAIIVVAEALPSSWPKGMKWSRPSEPSWRDVESRMVTELPYGGWDQFAEWYTAVRIKYRCIHSSDGIHRQHT